jgi:FkbM family methyltransferase
MALDIRAGRYTEPEVDLVAACVQAGDTVVDVGANYGMYVVPLSRAAGPTGRVIAFEPVPFTSAVLRRVVRLMRLRNVDVIAKGCGDEPGVMSFTVPVQGTGTISAGQAHFSFRQDQRPGKERHVRWPESTTVEAEVIRIDDMVPANAASRVSFLKCDIEGAELFALRGATELLRKHQPVLVVEINPWFLEGFGTSVGHLVELLADLGYALHFYDHENGRVVPVEPSSVVEDNYVFLPQVLPPRIASMVAS